MLPLTSLISCSCIEYKALRAETIGQRKAERLAGGRPQDPQEAMFAFCPLIQGLSPSAVALWVGSIQVCSILTQSRKIKYRYNIS